MIDNDKTAELWQALKDYKRTEVDQAFKKAIEGAVNAGYRVSLYYQSEEPVAFGSNGVSILPGTLVGQPTGILVEKITPGSPSEVRSDLAPDDRAKVRGKLQEVQRHIMMAKAALSGLHLFTGGAAMRPLQEALNTADNKAQSTFDSV